MFAAILQPFRSADAIDVGAVTIPAEQMSNHSKRSTANAGQRSGPWILATTIIGSSMAYIDGTVVNVALPVLQKDFNVSIDAAQWVVEAYTLMVASLVLVGGTLGDRYGRRRIYATGVALYAAASVWCGLAPGVEQLVIARAVQGLGGALLIPGSLAIIASSFTGEARGKAIGTWSGLSAVSTAVGPLLGGWLVDHISWRGVFFINVPLAVIVLLLLFKHVPESRDEGATGSLDWLGAALAATGLGAFVFGLIEANNRGFGDMLVVASLGMGVILLAAFIIAESRASSPMMPLSLFRSRNFSGANLLTLLLYAALNGMFFFLGFNLIQVQGYSATATGAATLPFIILISTLSRWAGRLTGRFGARLPMVVGPLVAAAGFALLAFTGVGGSYWTSFLPPITLVGLGMAITIAPLTSTVMNAVGERQAGTASGINNAVSWLSGLLVIAVLGLTAVGIFSNSLRARFEGAHTPGAVSRSVMAQRSKLAAIELPASLSGNERAAVHRMIADSFIDAFRAAMLTCAGLAAAGGLCGLMIERKKSTKNRRS
jgi:EmrB/QacA subfamily drug resistance transporter